VVVSCVVFVEELGDRVGTKQPAGPSGVVGEEVAGEIAQVGTQPLS
jgi:hypothetical protein